jgi:hypothetical protein
MDKELNSLPFRPQTDDEIKIEREKNALKTEERKQLIKERSQLFRNKTGANLLREWSKTCGFMQSVVPNSAPNGTIDPYRMAWLDGKQQAVRDLFNLLENDLLTTILKND